MVGDTVFYAVKWPNSGGTVSSIGDHISIVNDYWYIDGVSTGVKARGDKGETGAKGDKGDTGPKGDKGDKGATPVRGTDYWTASDITVIQRYVDEAILKGKW